MQDRFETFLESEIRIAETCKEELSQPMMRMTYVGQVAAFRAALEIYRRIREENALIAAEVESKE